MGYVSISIYEKDGRYYIKSTGEPAVEVRKDVYDTAKKLGKKGIMELVKKDKQKRAIKISSYRRMAPRRRM